MNTNPTSTLGKQLDYLFATAREGALAHFIIALVTWLLLANGVHADARWAVHAMFALMVVASLAMVVLAQRYHRAPVRDERVLAGFADAHAAVVLYGAAIWGLSAFLTIGQSLEVRAFFTLAWAGVSMGAVSSQHSSLRSSLISIWGSNVMVALVYVLSVPGRDGWAIGAMVLTFGVLLSVLALRNNKFVRENLQLNQAMAQQLQELEELSHRLAYAQQQAQASERAKSRLLAQASHDFRQPVHAIGIMAECLRDNLTLPENLDMIRRIEASVAALSGMFRSFLDFYTLEAGRMQAQTQAVALQQVLNDLQDDADEMTRGTDVMVRVLPNRAWVLTDAAILGAMLRNLVSNAVKYGGGGVLVGCRRRDGALAIEVYDNGEGLNEAQQLEIFDEFVRVVDQERPTRDGIGLGLSITQRMAELLGLRIRVRSRLGQGTCFSIEGLPLTAADESASDAHDADWRTAASAQSGRSVLVLDDDAPTREGLQALLTRWGYVVSAHAMGDHPALQQASVLIVDQSLQGAPSGLDVARQWLAKGGRHCVLTTGLQDEGLRQQCEALGVVMLIKPVAPAQLRSLLLAFERQ